jgi:hypothetical protein
MRRGALGWVSAGWRSRRALCRGSCCGFERRGCDRARVREKRLLLTEDKDFGELVFRRERAVPGVVLMRINPENPALKAVRLAAAIERYGDGLFGRYTVIEGGRFRSRRLWSVG